MKYEVKEGMIYDPEDGQTVAIMSDNATPEQGELLAAAPEMLEALRECITDPGSVALSRHAVEDAIRRLNYISDIARQAITKATGTNIVRFQCPECETWYDYEDRAADCCA